MKVLPKVFQKKSEEIIKKIHQSNFWLIEKKLREKGIKNEIEYKGIESASKLIEAYKKFLVLIFKYPEERLVPTEAIDEVWHLHILDTRNYMEFCEEFFGEYLHHDPSLGADETSKKELATLFQRTKELWKKEFNETMDFAHEFISSSSCEATCAGRCHS